MRRFLPALVFLLMAFLATPSVASAQEYNHIITVYASVAEQRAIYLNESGNIIKIAGNTVKNLAPTVFDSNNKEIAMTPAVQSQYDNFLKQHGYHLEASKIYKLNPVTIDLTPNTQTIGVSNAGLSLGNLAVD